MKVMKFGGSSVADVASIARVVDIVRDNVSREGLCVVVSAMKGVTDEIIDLAKAACLKDEAYKERLHNLKKRHLSVFEAVCEDPAEYRDFVENQCGEIHSVCDGVYALGELSPKVLDRLMAFGELCSARILTLACRGAGLAARFEDSRDYIVTDNRFGRARVDFARTDAALNELNFSGAPVLVFPGLIARCTDGRVTTLGRDGSDYTAAIIGAAIGAEAVEIWTNVNGVMTANPEHVADARSIPQMSYEEAMELSHFGARVIHPPTMHPLTARNIPIIVRNTFNPSFVGTRIGSETAGRGGILTGISAIPRVSFLRLEGPGMVGVRGVAGRLFSALAAEDVNLIMISQGSSEHSICFAVVPDDEDKSVDVISREFAVEMSHQIVLPPAVERNKCAIAVVGDNMRSRPGIAGRLFSCLGDADVNILAIAQGSSERNISMVIDAADETRALVAIHSAFF